MKNHKQKKYIYIYRFENNWHKKTKTKRLPSLRVKFNSNTIGAENAFMTQAKQVQSLFKLIHIILTENYGTDIFGEK